MATSTIQTQLLSRDTLSLASSMQIQPVRLLNKWLKQYVTGGCTMHSFRHLLRDRIFLQEATEVSQ